MALGPRAGVVKDTVAQEAFALAMTLVKGWDKKERGPIEQYLNDFKDASAHNEKARLAAQEACDEMSRIKVAQQRAAADIQSRESKLADEREAFEGEKAEHSDRITGLSRALTNERKEFEDYRRKAEADLSAREKAAKDTRASGEAQMSTATDTEAKSLARDRSVRDREERLDVFVKAMSELVASWNPK